MEEDEPAAERSLPEWVQLEYLHMRTLAGKDARIYFTSLSSASARELDAVFGTSLPDAAPATAHQEPVLALMERLGIPMDKICLLDPKAAHALAPEDGERFQSFLFGGILGDDPPRDRTSELRKLGFPTRHLGSVQMTTDTALGVTKKVVADKVNLQDIPYVDHPTITFSAKESVEMPFRYIAKNDQPVLPPGMRELLYKDLNKSFEF